MTKKILILGGTSDARQLADVLEKEAQYDVLTSLAGRTSRPQLPSGAVRTGGFGGADALAQFLTEGGFSLMVDATHPYAAQISANAAKASQQAGVPCFRLERPAWYTKADNDWIPAPDAKAAAALLPKGARVLLTIGRQEIGPFVQRLDISVLARMIERPETVPLAPHKIMQARPPFSLEDEILLMRTEHISHLVTKNAGGSVTASKLDAAKKRDITVIMIDRPDLPRLETARNIEHALATIDRLLGATGR